MNARPPALTFATPRRLPKPATLEGRVVVLDIAFASDGAGVSFEKVTGAFLKGLGERLAAWVDHHDHAFHDRYRADPRFVLSTKAAHGACPEMVTHELVARTGPIDSILCHVDLDGLYAAAKWIRGGDEPYPGADADARAVDTRMGVPSGLGSRIDQALRVRGRDDAFLRGLVWFLAGGASDAVVRLDIDLAADQYAAVRSRTAELASSQYVVHGSVAVCDVTDIPAREYDKTELLLLGQRHATVAVVYDAINVTMAAAFDSGVDFLSMLGITGGMPTVLSVPRRRLADALRALVDAGLYRADSGPPLR